MNLSPEEMGAAAGTKGRIMALDLGEKRIGLALSDESRTLARPFKVLKRSSRVADYESIKRISEEQGIVLLVIGLPKLLSGEEGDKARWVRDYSAQLSQAVELPIEFWDESFSTKDALESMKQRGISRKHQKKRIDAVASAFILQQYLDARENASFLNIQNRP